MPSRPTRRPTLTIMSTAAASNASTDAPCITLPSPSSVALLQPTYMSVLDTTADSEATIRWCMAVGLLPTSQLCTKCHQDMRLDVGCKRWRCGRTKCRTERNLIKGTFFSECKVPLRKAVRLLCFWGSRTPVTNAADMAEVSEKAASEWYSKCREICTKEMMPCPMEVGGEGHIVEIDETSLKKKSKYNRGKRYPDVWLFGGADRTTNNWFGILTYSNRTKPVLTTIIKQYIKPGTTIMSNQYASYVSVNQKHTLANYKPLREMHYKHEWAHHSKNYVDPDTGAQTNRIEGTWEIRIKQYIKRMRGMPVDMIPEYLDEYLWRSWFLPEKATPTDSLRGLIKAIRKYA